MIARSSCFILGAGASAPYGFPTGYQLRQWLRKQLEVYCIQNVYGVSGGEVNEMSEFRREIKRFITEYSESTHGTFIDLFINRREKDFSWYGRWAIVAAIFSHEFNSIFGDDIKKPEQDWMSVLMQRLTDDIQDGQYDKITDSKISFITFNYDRSIEHFLFTRIINDFGAKASKAADIVKSIPIIHMYGKIAPLPWEANARPGVEYKKNLKSLDLSSFVENIKVMYGDRASDNAEKAQELISNCRDLYFLGFGYAKENLDLLGKSGELRTAIPESFGQ